MFESGQVALFMALRLILWVPLVILWILFSALFVFFDVLGCMASTSTGGDYIATRWHCFGVRAQANYPHADAGGSVQ